jgi:hypothetical protein
MAAVKPYAGKGSGQEGRMADGMSRPMGMIASAPREVRPTGALDLRARHRSSVAFMLCRSPIVTIAFPGAYHVAGPTPGAIEF